MVHEYSEQDIVTNNFGWLTLQTYELWNKGKSLSSIKEALVPGATKDCKVGEEYYNSIIDFINNTYNGLHDKDECNKYISATKVLTLNLVFLLAKKVANYKDRKSDMRHETTFKELIRIGKSLGLFSEYIQIGCVEHNMGYFEHLLTGEMDRFEKGVNEKGGAPIESTLKLLSSIEIALKCRDKKHTKKVGQAWLMVIVIIGLIALVI